MPRLYTIAWVMMLTVALLTACSGAPAPQNSGAATVAPAAATATAPAAQPAATVANTLPVPQSAFTDHPNDASQARLRLAHLVSSGPNIDFFVNGDIAVNGGKAQINMPAGYVNSYLFLAPGTYSVAVVPTGKILDQALLGPLDVTIAAGHRYTLAMIGQLKDNSIKPLVIDETTAEQQLGAKPTDTVRIMVNNLAGVAGIDVEIDGKMVNTNIPYGGFAAGVYPAGIAHLRLLEHGKNTILWDRVTRGDQPASSRLVGFAGQYTAGGSQNLQLFVPTPTSQLNLIDFLHSYSGRKVTTESNPTNPATFETFLAAIEKAGLTEILATGGPYLVAAPTDETFAALPKGQLDALMANPKAIGDLVRNHIVEGYVPRGSLQDTPGGNAIERPFTNLLGAKMTIGADFAVNGVDTGGIESTFLANGSHVHPIYKVLLLATSPVNPLVGTWQRTNSCKSFVQAYKDAGLIDLAPDWLVGGGYFSSPDKIDKTNMCKGATEVAHSHFFTASGGFGSRDDTGAQVDDGHYTVVDDHTIAFDNGMKVQYRIDGDTAMFTVVPPASCTGGCRQDYAWANGAFYPGPFQRVAPDTTAKPAVPAQSGPNVVAADVPTSTAEIIFKGHTGRVVQAAFSPDGKTVLTGSEDGTARLWDATTGKELRQFIGHTDELRGAIFSPDGKTIFTTSNDKTARLWDVATGKELRQFIGHTETVNKAAFSPDGKLVVTTSPDDGTARVWNVSTAKSLLTFTGHTPSAPNRVAFSPVGKAIVTGGKDGTVLMWDPLTGTILKTFRGHTATVGTPAFSPDGKYLVTPSDDSTARLWDVASAKELRRFEVPGVVIAGAAFSPDGRYLATSGFDGIARLWDAQTGKELRRFVGHTDEVRTVAFSPDGNYILTASHDGTARLWRVG